MGRVWGWVRGLPRWAQILLAIVVVGGLVGAVSGDPPQEEANVSAGATTTSRRSEDDKRTTTTVQRETTTTTRFVTPTTTRRTSTTKRAAARSEAARCLQVPLKTVDQLSAGLNVQGGGFLRYARAVKSRDFSSAYFITADLEGSGLSGPDDLATWVTNKLEGDGVFYSVDSAAKEFSDWGDGSKTDSGFSMADDGAEESRKCADDAKSDADF